ncbi:MAG: putative ATPase, AAA+ ATPase superfamily, partial [Candidatus Methanomarinus sp.]
MTANELLPKIEVDRDFTMGDTSGQVAIGTGNRQYQKCVFNLPVGSTLSSQSLLYTPGIRPSTDPAKIFGRQGELEKIDDIFKHNSALALTGFRGTGKSTLASMYIDRLEKKGEFAGIYWRKVDETIDISDVVNSFFSVIGKPIKDLERYKIGDQLTLLFRELNAAPYFLVLDNFEIILDPRTNEPKAQKVGFSELIENATENAGVSRFLFTSWESPAGERGIRPTCYTIGGLDPSAAVQLLKHHGLTEADNELEKAVKLAGGHPLALILLTQLVIGGSETLSGLLKETTLWMGEKGEVAERILDKVYSERLDEEERKLLQYVSL